MQAKYNDDVEFFVVYCREAHAADSSRPMGKDVEQPVSTKERRDVAIKFLDEMDLEMPALLDNIDDQTSRDYASHPDRLYLVGKDGKVAYAGGKGPRGFKPDELEQAIQKELAQADGAAEKSPKTGGGEVDPQMERRLKSMPVFAAMNTDDDVQLSAEEIEAAPESLLSLDKNGDGELSAEELRPVRRRR